MNTRHMIACLAMAFSLALLLPPRSSVAAGEEQGAAFLRIGSFYRIITVGGGAPTTVKILAPAGGQWFRVEAYSARPFPPGQPTLEKWINFANVVSVTETQEPTKKEPDKKEPEK